MKSRFRSQKSTDAPTTFFAPASVAWLFGGGGGDDDDDDGDVGKEATEGFVVDAVLVRHDLDGGGLQFVVDPRPMRISFGTEKKIVFNFFGQDEKPNSLRRISGLGVLPRVHHLRPESGRRLVPRKCLAGAGKPEPGQKRL